ncbi:MAG: polysaccharide deacetylase family protein [Candidatus Magnetoovum sp. WYHC-5]|nr:polysaccharide deacetylase family protein [Candidatus Magnetoovum sp. WYHC-5]
MYKKQTKIFKRFFKHIVATTIGTYLEFSGPSILKKSLTIFIYHDVTNTPSEFSRMYNLYVNPNVFDYQIGYIKKTFNVITPKSLIDGNIPPNAALITFDDGLKNVFTQAYSILKKHNVPAIVFLNMEPINEGTAFWAGLITYLCEKRSDFCNYLYANLTKDKIKTPLFLSCSRELVLSFLQDNNLDLNHEIKRFIGDFATPDDLNMVASENILFFGNHLYNHDVALLLSDTELIDSYRKNDTALSKYPNSCKLFAFPFGQQFTCFEKRQISLICQEGAKKVFSSHPIPNNDVSMYYLHRIELTNFNNTSQKIWYQIFYKNMRTTVNKLIKPVNQKQLVDKEVSYNQ